MLWDSCGDWLIDVSMLLATAVASPGRASEGGGWPTQLVGSTVGLDLPFQCLTASDIVQTVMIKEIIFMES